MPPQSILDKNKDLGSLPAPRGARESGPIIDMFGPPIKKLTLSKAAAFVLNFKLYPPPPDERLAPLSRLLCCRLWILVIRINTCHRVLFSCRDLRD